MTEQTPSPNPAEAPIDPLSTHPASPFLRTEAPEPVAFASPPSPLQIIPASSSTWVTYRTQIEFGLAILAYLMVLVGSVVVVQANPQANWRYIVALVPIAPAAFVMWLVMRGLARLDELQKRIQMQAFGFSLGSTALLTFGYGFLQGAGLPQLSWTYILPLMAVLWALGTAIFSWRYR
ncbi:MAG TPA: hypothetical protein VNU27_12720 [Candidatus Acidoferrum sp.]|jgi:hypothetical protein|nr:hypothetical protein [Candidatus Acidoferrum sp.]